MAFTVGRRDTRLRTFGLAHAILSIYWSLCSVMFARNPQLEFGSVFSWLPKWRTFLAAPQGIP